MAMVNSWTLYRYSNPANKLISQKKFIVAWLKTFTKEALPPKPTVLATFGSHWNVPLYKYPKRCIHCKRYELDSSTSYGCEGCGVPLHRNCHKEYHEKLLEQ